MQGCVNTEQDIIEKVESEVGSLAGSLAHADFIGPRVHAKIRNLIDWDLPKLVKETKNLRAEVARLQGIGVEYEYSVQFRYIESGKAQPISEGDWTSREEADDWLALVEKAAIDYPEMVVYETRLVKRRKAGKVETV
jgi:hypothetical protein